MNSNYITHFSLDASGTPTNTPAGRRPLPADIVPKSHALHLSCKNPIISELTTTLYALQTMHTTEKKHVVTNSWLEALQRWSDK